MLKIFTILFILNHLTYGFIIHKIPASRTKDTTIGDQFTDAILHRTSNTHFMELRLKDRVVKLLNVPDVMQATQYTCGPSSLSAVLNYYHLAQRQSKLAKLAHTQEEFGTGPRNLLGAVKQLNISGQLKQGMRISQLQVYINSGRPVIVQIQAWGDEGTDYSNDFDDGHYVVVIGYDSAYLYFEDPWILGSIGYIKKSQFLERWHDQVHSQSRKVYNIGIIVQLQPKPTPVVIKLE